MKREIETCNGDTVRIRRPPRVYTDERGRTVWMGRVEPCELELADRVDSRDAGPNFELCIR